MNGGGGVDFMVLDYFINTTHKSSLYYYVFWVFLLLFILSSDGLLSAMYTLQGLENVYQGKAASGIL